MTATHEKARRLDVANAACALFIPETRLELDGGSVVVRWEDHAGAVQRKRWRTRRGQSFYPTWYGKWCHGGTCSTALSQLVRWVRLQPVLPLGTWGYWCGDTVGLARCRVGDRREELIKTLADGGYPAHATCVLCGLCPVERYDWWDLDGVTGPCCWHTTGCRQGDGARCA